MNTLFSSPSYSIGIDTVEIERFKHWHGYSHHSLRKIYSPQELEYCLSNPKKSAERFAVRLAAKEAFLKALSQLVPEQKLSLLTICTTVSINRKTEVPSLIIDWETLKNHGNVIKDYKSTLSLTHSKISALAIVLLYI